MTLVSSKMSSLRSPNFSERTPTSSASSKPLVFNPLRSLPWFQVTRLGFERHAGSRTTTIHQHPELDKLSDLEKGSSTPLEPADETTTPSDIQSDIGAREFRHSEIILDPDDDKDGEIFPTAPSQPLRIMKRQSIEQNSAYASPTSASARKSIGSLLPGQWFGDGSAKRLLPRR